MVRRYVSPPSTPPVIEHRHIPSGLAGTKKTVQHVGRLIRDGARDFYVRQKAIDILLERAVPPKDYLGEIDTLFKWVQRNVRYTKDPFRIEVLHSPRRMLELRAGDCDDMTILLGALVKSVGHPVRIVLTGPDGRRPDLFSHIYLEAHHRGEWIPLDATMPYPMGWSPAAPVRQVLSIEEESNDDRTASAAPGSHRRAGSHASAQPRLAARPASRDTSGWRAAQRSAGEGVVESAAQPSTARAQSLASRSAAIHLAERPQRPSSAAHDRQDAGAAQKLGSAVAETASADRRPSGETSVARCAAPATSRSSPRRHTAADAAGPSDPPAGASLLSGALRDAAALYRRFSQFPAHRLERIAHPRIVPPVVVELGQLVGLVYRSDKWVGRPRTYIHFMQDPPRLVTDVTGRRLFVVGGRYRVTARGIEG